MSKDPYSTGTFGLVSAWQKKMDEHMMAVLIAPRTPRVKLTRWQKAKRFLTKKRYPGQWLTYKLMAHYGIYESDY